MIFTESTIKISNNVSKMDSTIVLYRGDKNVEIRFTILQSPFKYSNTVATNVIESTNASYGQLVIKTPNDKPPIFSEVSATKEGTVLFTITKEMIDEIEELGVYTFQIRLLDENKQSRVTIPPVENGIEIKEPIAIEDDNSTNVVGLAKANYAVATLSDVNTPTFDDNGKYNKTNWNDGDIITNASLNKIEDGIYTTNENITATKKYVDDKITVKILPVDYNKNCITNVADLEPHSIYMSPNDAKFLYLAYEKLSGSLVGFLFTAKVHGRFIYTGAKDDTMIEIMIEGSCYTVHFKTDTVDGHVEKTVFYLTKNNTTEFTPTNDYEPATKKYVDDNTVIYPLPVHTIQENDKTILKIVNIMDLIPGVQYSTYRDINQTKTEGYRVVYICDDGTFKLICTLPVKDKIIHLLKVLHSTNYSTLSYHNTAYKVDYSKHSTNTDIQITKTLQDYIPIANITEYNPTRDYHPATKKYVDDKFICTDIVDNVGTIPKEELQKCNNGTSRYVSSIKFKEFFADYEHCIYQGTYGDKKIRMKYDKDYNRMIAYDLTDVIELGFEFDNNYMYPFNAGTDEVKAYQFTNDLVITKSPVLNPSEVLTKNNTHEYTPTNDYNPATKKYVDDNTPIKSLPVDPTSGTGAIIEVNKLTSSGCYALPKRSDGKDWTDLMMKATINDGSGKGKAILLSGYQNFVFHVNVESKKIYCDNLRIVYNIGTTADTTYINTEPYYLPTTNTKEYIPTKEYHPATKKYVDDNKIGYIKSETVGETIDTSTMVSSFSNNSYIYESNNVTYLEVGKEYHVIVNGIRYRALCINNMPGNDQIYESIAVNGDGFSIAVMNKIGYNTKYYQDNTKCAYEINLSDELLAAPPTIQILKMDIEYIPTYLMPKDLGILNSISVNRIGDIGTSSAAIGYKNTASNDFTFAMGMNTTANAVAAHAEGGFTVANASYSHAEGFKSISTGQYSHVEGIVCESSGQGSHAEGYYTVASGERSHSEGCFTEAASQYQHVQGKYNVVDSTGAYAHIVGNGANKNARSNAHTLDWQGNAWYAGKVTAGAAPVEDMDLTTKKYVDDKVSSLPQISFNENGELVVTINGVSKTFVPKNV